jgi:hypothetical protein
MIHDATTGFHDIKPLPEFMYSSINPIIIFLFIFLLLVGLYIYRKKIKAVNSFAGNNLPPEMIALHRLNELTRQLKNESINLRDFSTSMSLCLREYLGRIFEFNAVDQTSKEVHIALTDRIYVCLPSVSESEISRILSDVSEIFKLSDFITFSTSPEASYKREDIRLVEAINAAILIINRISKAIQMEVELAKNTSTSTAEGHKTNAI